MSSTIDYTSESYAVEHLPVWWRCVLIAVSMLILCSCSSPAVRTQLAADKSLMESPGANENDSNQYVASQPPALPGVSATAGDPINSTVVEPPAEPGAVGVCECGPQAGGGINGQVGASTCNGEYSIDPYGPVMGPSDEYLCDGGDFGSPAGVRADWKIEGLEPEDAISHYDTMDGRTLVVPSNRVCIYAPRFAAVRRVVEVMANEQPVFVKSTMEERAAMKADKALPPIAAKQRHAVAVDLGQKPPSLFRQREQAGGLERLQATMDTYSSLKPYADLQIIRTGEISQAEKPLVERAMEAAIKLTGVQAPQVAFGVKMAQAEVGVRQPGLVYQTSGPKSPKLRLCKLASTGNALPGEEVEFTLRFDNIGDQVIGNVTIADNLAPRFEYIPGSAKSSLDADLVTEPNDVGSVVLRWEIKDPLKPGDGGILRFKVRVR
jgi:uncharacterized repeat protein (TIGR01451 family)